VTEVTKILNNRLFQSEINLKVDRMNYHPFIANTNGSL